MRGGDAVVDSRALYKVASSVYLGLLEGKRVDGGRGCRREATSYKSLISSCRGPGACLVAVVLWCVEEERRRIVRILDSFEAENKRGTKEEARNVKAQEQRASAGRSGWRGGSVD